MCIRRDYIPHVYMSSIMSRTVISYFEKWGVTRELEMPTCGERYSTTQGSDYSAIYGEHCDFS